MRDRIEFLGIGIDKVKADDATQRILQYGLCREKKVITYLNAHCFNLALKECL